jgi:hypothetical protein
VVALVTAGCGADTSGGSGRTGRGGSDGSGGNGSGSGAAGGDSPFGNSTNQPTAGTTGDKLPIGMGGDMCEAISETAPPGESPVDIVWVIDSSGSMGDEQLRVQTNIQSFVDQISAAGLDTRVVIITDKDLVPPTSALAMSGNYLFIAQPVNSHDALQQLTAHYPTYSTFLRPGATTHFIVLTDDESDYTGATPDERAANFVKDMRALYDGRDMCMDPSTGCVYTEFIVHAIASPGDVGALPCVPVMMGMVPMMCAPLDVFCLIMMLSVGGAAAPGVTYTKLSMQTAGLFASICESDWMAVFGPLVEAVITATPLPCNYTIPPAPAGQNFARDKVNVNYMAPDGMGELFPKADGVDACPGNKAWYFDDDTAPSEVLLCPDACAAVAHGGQIDLAFGCATIVLE